jgi:hypothetical protein
MKKIEKIIAVCIPLLCLLALFVAHGRAGQDCYRPKDECTMVVTVHDPTPHLEFRPCGTTTNKPPSVGTLATTGESGKKATKTLCGKVLGIDCNPTLGKTCKE